MDKFHFIKSILLVSLLLLIYSGEPTLATSEISGEFTSGNQLGKGQIIFYPEVKTNDIDFITSTSAKLKGKLTKLGNFSNIEVSFEYGETEELGNEITAETKNSMGEFSVILSGLTPNTSYHFKAKAKVGDIIIYGSDKNFTTIRTINNGTTGGGGYTPSSNTSSLNNHLKISSTQTGTLNQSLSDGKNVKVKIPKGSIKSITTFAVSKGSLENGDVPKDKVGAFLFDGLVFSVKAVDTNNKAIKSFSKDLTITLTVPDLPANTSNLGLYYFDDKNNKWVVIENVEFGNNTITFKVNHLTKFAVFTVKEKSSDSSKSKGKVLSAESVNIVDGDIIQAQTSSDPFAVYIVKIVGNTKYIRHIVSLEIFNHYGNLKWENLKQVDSLDGYSLSGWVRVNTGPNGTPGPTDKVYEINGDQTKHWINMTAEQFLSHGGSDAAIYTVNQGELNLYTTGPDVVFI